VGLGSWWKKVLRERDQETVVLAEQGIAPEGEIHQTEEWVGEKRHHDQAGDPASGQPADGDPG